MLRIAASARSKSQTHMTTISQTSITVCGRRHQSTPSAMKLNTRVARKHDMAKVAGFVVVEEHRQVVASGGDEHGVGADDRKNRRDAQESNDPGASGRGGVPHCRRNPRRP